MSSTTNSFMLGIKSDGQWIGEELVLSSISTPFVFPYSVISKTKMKVLEISKPDMI